MTHLNRFAIHAAGLLLLAGFTVSAFASTFVVTEDELHPEVFPQVAESIRANLEGPHSPKDLTRGERRQVEDALDRMEAMIDEDPVRHHSRIRNLQRQVNATLTPRVARNTANADVVCERVKTIGSNIPTTVCTNRAERDLEANLSKEEVHRLRQLQSLDDSGLVGDDGRIK